MITFSRRFYSVLAFPPRDCSKSRRRGFHPGFFADGVAFGVEELDRVDERQALSGPSTWDRSPTTRIAIFSGVMYSRATRSTSALVTASTRDW